MSPFGRHFFDVNRSTEACCSAKIPLSENRQAKLPISTDHTILRREVGSLCLCIGGTRMLRQPCTTAFGNLYRLAKKNGMQLCVVLWRKHRADGLRYHFHQVSFAHTLNADCYHMWRWCAWKRLFRWGNIRVFTKLSFSVNQFLARPYYSEESIYIFCFSDQRLPSEKRELA